MPRSRRIDPDVEDVETEEEAPAPRRRRTTTAAATPEAAPATTRRRRTSTPEPEPEPVDEAEEEDDEEEEPAPVARRRTAAKAPAKAEPVRRRAAAPKDEDETGDEDDDDEAAVIPISRGRKEIKKNRPQSEASLLFFRWDEEPQLVKFLDNEPWSYDQHWIQRDGKQSFPCLGKGCPLCAIGVKVSQKIVYPILNLTPPKGEEFLTQSLEVGPTLDDTLFAHDQSTKSGPLTRLWWEISRTESGSKGKRKKYNYVFTPVKDRDLGEDWDLDLDEAEDAVAAAKIPEPKTVLGEWNRSQLQEIADEAMGH